MLMTPAVRKFALTTHVAVSVGWVGALAVFFAHALACAMSRDEQIVRAVSLAMGLTAWLVILPLSLATLVTGLVQAVGSAWGLLRHYWIIFKLILTVVATFVLLLKMQPISYLAEQAAQAAVSMDEVQGLRNSLAIHGAGGLLVLLAAFVLAMYKPAGLTRLAPPRWAKFFGAVLAVFLLLLAVMVLLGAHGPHAH